MRSIPLIFAILASAMGLPLNGAAAGATDVEQQELKVQERSFSSVRNLAVDGFTGTLNIEAHDGSDVQLRIEGPKRLVNALQAKISAGTLTLEGPEVGSGSSVSIVQVGDGDLVVGSTVISSGTTGSISVISSSGSSTIIVNNSPGVPALSERPFKVFVRLPLGTPVAIAQFVGTAAVHDIGAPVDLTLLSGEAELDHVLDGRLEIAGSGSARIAQATGSLSIDVIGSGDVTVMDGEISDLAVSIAGAGDVSVDGRAQRAVLELTGAGRLHVAEVVDRPSISVTGAGDVTIGNW